MQRVGEHVAGDDAGRGVLRPLRANQGRLVFKVSRGELAHQVDGGASVRRVLRAVLCRIRTDRLKTAVEADLFEVHTPAELGAESKRDVVLGRRLRPRPVEPTANRHVINRDRLTIALGEFTHSRGKPLVADVGFRHHRS